MQSSTFEMVHSKRSNTRFLPTLDCEQSLFFFSFSEGSRDARNQGGSARRKNVSRISTLSHLAPQSRAFRVSRVLLDGLRKKRDWLPVVHVHLGNKLFV